MTAILQDDGTLLVPVDGSCAADRVRPGDHRYADLLAESVPAATLHGTIEEDASLAARFERQFRESQPRSA
jgi:hypothetical protein